MKTPPRFIRLLPSLLAGLIALMALGLFTARAVSRQAAKKASAQGEGSRPESAAVRPGMPRLPTPGQRQEAVARRVLSMLRIPQKLDQVREQLVMMNGFSSDDFRIAMKVCGENPSEETRETSRMFLDGWVQRFPVDAVDHSGGQALSDWAALDSDVALKWLLALEPGERQNQLTMEVIPIIGGADPEGTLKLLNHLPAGLRPDALARLMPIPGPAEVAIRWVESQEDPGLRMDLLRQFCAVQSLSVVNLQLDLMAKYPELQSTMNFRATFDMWAKTNQPEAAHAALERVPEGEPRLEAIRAMAPLSVMGDNAGWATEMMERYPAAVNDRLLADCACASSLHNPPRALEFSEGIQEPFLHDQTAAAILSSWLRGNDPGAAEAWMSEHEISDSIRQKMATNPDPMSRFR